MSVCRLWARQLTGCVVKLGRDLSVNIVSFFQSHTIDSHILHASDTKLGAFEFFDMCDPD